MKDLIWSLLGIFVYFLFFYWKQIGENIHCQKLILMFYFLYINLAFVFPRDLLQQNEKDDTKINKKGERA